ncbi:polysaccharide deacetylase family protein [Neobacillus endophyticus]|uniref:polysaccharide deacetylase family protein n=1 Tax=Neobacillus endophyticus TaxID=2738405 RepID=UPI0028ADC1BE|nr:polysaccharide deacetylase family protein [Neobacillus endophyticus]
MTPSYSHAQQRVPILVYHSIAQFPGHGLKELYVTPENFEKQMNYLKNNGFTLLTFEQWKDINKVQKPILITVDDGYKNNLTVYDVFKKIQTGSFRPSEPFFIISDFIGRPNRLSNSDLKILAESGMISIQSHTATHPDLTKANRFIEELKDSKNKIEQITGKPVIALSYPFGNFNSQVIAETKKYYLFGLTTTPGPYIKTDFKDEQYLLPRTYIKYSTTLQDFMKIVNSNVK